MNTTDVIKHPLLTEKSTVGMNEHGRYSFVVDRRATKTDVKRAVESLYGVKVERVWTQNQKGRRRRFRYGWVKEPVIKKASVRLVGDQTIELF